MNPKPPYLLVSFDVDPADANAGGIIADVEQGFPPQDRPVSLGVDHLFVITVPSSQATARFVEVGMYLMLKDQEHGGVLRWVLQLCRVDEFASS